MNNKYSNYSIFCSLCFFSLTSFSAYIMYLVFGVKLLSDRGLKEQCEESHITLYYLLNLILVFFQIPTFIWIVINFMKKTKIFVTVLFINIILEEILIIWGYCQLFQSACKDLEENSVYYMSYITIIFQCVKIGVYCMTIALTGLFDSFIKERFIEINENIIKKVKTSSTSIYDDNYQSF